jgi:hypothetical protein
VRLEFASQQADSAAVSSYQAEQDPQERRLARAVRAEQAVHGPATNEQIHTIDRCSFAIPLREAHCVDRHLLHGGASYPADVAAL